jgi:hypothetical protein
MDTSPIRAPHRGSTHNCPTDEINLKFVEHILKGSDMLDKEWEKPTD